MGLFHLFKSKSILAWTKNTIQSFFDSIGMPIFPSSEILFNHDNESIAYSPKTKSFIFWYGDVPKESTILFNTFHESIHFMQDFCLSNNIHQGTINSLNAEDFIKILSNFLPKENDEKREIPNDVAKEYFERFKDFVINCPYLTEEAVKILRYDDAFYFSAPETVADENNRIISVTFTGGCPGNTLGICKLVKGMYIDDVIQILEGTKCRFSKTGETSCPDQLAKALKLLKDGNNC